tara:strand:+ start:9490 stop:9948 length:459 start_codon:yes stop_codon:yes gene_type:complete
MKIEKITVRVYGLLMNDKGEILLADERLKGTIFTKFPGGGLELGEGTIDCLKREFLEELNQPIEILEHFYTTDFFQRSAFHKIGTQIVSIYYIVKPQGTPQFTTVEIPFDFQTNEPETEVFRWIKLADLTAEDVTFPIDKIVVNKLKQSIEV